MTVADDVSAVPLGWSNVLRMTVPEEMSPAVVDVLAAPPVNDREATTAPDVEEVDAAPPASDHDVPAAATGGRMTLTRPVVTCAACGVPYRRYLLMAYSRYSFHLIHNRTI